MRDHLIIAIDGPAGAGKSTVARRLAELLDIHILDTGALFRACAWYVLQAGLEPSDMLAVNELLKNVKIDIRISGSDQRTLINGEDVSENIRTPNAAQAASTLGGNAFVRRVITEQVRIIAKTTSLVVDGRDIGTAMLPNATVKFFLTASAQERARRRHLEQKQQGIMESYDEVLQKLIMRDQADSSREIAPLKRAQDAVLIDSTDKTSDQVLDIMARTIKEKTQ